MKIVFMGTPAFAVPALQALISSSHQVISVYTQPPRPTGRGYKQQLSPVHKIALDHNIQVFHPITLRSQVTQQEFIDLQCDIAIVAAYGLILPEQILYTPNYGCLNIHPSLLPGWRGAAPIQRTILAGDRESGVCIIKLVQELDAGAILASHKIALEENITTTMLHNRLSMLGAELLVNTLNNIDNIIAIPQDIAGITYASKLDKQEGHIIWNDSAQVIHRKIRALNPWPGVYFTYQNEMIKILEAEYLDDLVTAEVGTVLDDKLSINCGKGVLHPKILQRPGRKALAIDDFLRGFNISKGTIL